MKRAAAFSIIGFLLLTLASCETNCGGLWDPCTNGDASCSGGGSTIGPPTGAQCTVISSQEVQKADPARCNNNDIGVPNMGLYREDQLSCTTYDQNGKPQATTTQTKDTFERCYEP
jgi:hypothetical protein